jgi:anti-anti-sigma factor
LTRKSFEQVTFPAIIMTLSKDSITGILRISGALDIDAATSLREALLDCFLHQPEVTVDLTAVDVCDTAALQVLLAGQRDGESLGKTFCITAASNSVTETAAALGFSIGGRTSAVREDHRDAA